MSKQQGGIIKDFMGLGSDDREGRLTISVSETAPGRGGGGDCLFGAEKRRGENTKGARPKFWRGSEVRL